METLKKGLTILDAIMNHSDSLSVEEIVQLTGLNTKSVYRAISVLVTQGFVQQQRRGRYTLGRKLASHGVLLDRERMIEWAEPVMQDLTKKLQESIHIAVLHGENAEIIQAIYSRQRLQMMTAVNEQLPLHCSSVGKLLFAFMNRSIRSRLLEKEDFHSYTRNTIVEPNLLRGELTRIRKEQVAFDFDELEKGLRAVSVPVRDDKNSVLAALSVSGPAVRLTQKRLTNLVSPLRKGAAEITQSLIDNGYFQD